MQSGGPGFLVDMQKRRNTARGGEPVGLYVGWRLIGVCGVEGHGPDRQAPEVENERKLGGVVPDLGAELKWQPWEWVE